MATTKLTLAAVRRFSRAAWDLARQVAQDARAAADGEATTHLGPRRFFAWALREVAAAARPRRVGIVMLPAFPESHTFHGAALGLCPTRSWDRESGSWSMTRADAARLLKHLRRWQEQAQRRFAQCAVLSSASARQRARRWDFTLHDLAPGISALTTALES